MIATILQRHASEPIKFPKLMEYRNGLVVLFTNQESGTVIIPGGSGWVVGSYCKDFTSSDFTDFEDTIILSNEAK